jgi:hypothetical protein
MAYKLVCVHPFHDPLTGRALARGDEITNQAHVAKHIAERDSHFRRVWIPDSEVLTLPAPSAPATSDGE